MNYRYKRRQRRSYGATLVLVLVVAVVIGVVNVAPRLLSYFRLVRVTANAPASVVRTETQVLAFQKPPISRRGFCESRSALIPRTNAWRCSVYTETYDPCFAADDAPTVVCGADPLAGIHGFHLDLTKPLPASVVTAANSRIKPAALLGLEYEIDLLNKPIRLVNGQFYALPEGAKGNAVLVALSQMQANGDLDGDNDEDVAALLVADAGKEGMYIYLAVIANEGGEARFLTSLSLGDRIQVDNLQIDHGQVVVNMKVHSPTDPICCPSQDATHFYNLVGNQLVRWSDGWRLLLADGTACAAVLQEASSGLQEAVYRCGDGRWLRSGLIPGNVWQAKLLGPPHSADEYVTIARLWQ